MVASADALDPSSPAAVTFTTASEDCPSVKVRVASAPLPLIPALPSVTSHVYVTFTPSALTAACSFTLADRTD